MVPEALDRGAGRTAITFHPISGGEGQRQGNAHLPPGAQAEELTPGREAVRGGQHRPDAGVRQAVQAGMSVVARIAHRNYVRSREL